MTNELLAVVILLQLFSILLQITAERKRTMKIRIEEATLIALVALAEAAVAADAHDKADLTALQETVADEKDMPESLKSRIDALTPPDVPTNLAPGPTQVPPPATDPTV